MNPWQGLLGQTRGFCNFKSNYYGVRAACKIIMVSYRKRGINTIGGIVQTFAPPSENHTDRYVSFVCGRTGLNPSSVLNAVDYPAVIAAMSVYEVGWLDSVSALFVESVIEECGFNDF